MKILVTGCAGFIGSHLSERLVGEGHEVIGVDIFTDYYTRKKKWRNLAGLISQKKFSLHERNILDDGVGKLVPDCDIIFHLAAQPGVRASWGDAFRGYVENNVLGTQKLLEAARRSTSLKRFVYASSSSVYGLTEAESVNEQHLPRPFSPYGTTKLAGEHLCSLYAANFSIDAVSLRFFTVYGPRQRPDMAFYRLIRASLNQTAFTLYGDGTQERDFTFVSDVVDGLVRAATIPSARGVFNIGGGNVTSLNQVIDEVSALSGKSVLVERKPAIVGDVRRTSADTSMIRKEMGFLPTVSLKDGIRAQFAWMAAEKEDPSE